MSTTTAQPTASTTGLRATLHSTYPAAPKAAMALADALVAVQQHSLWNIEDLDSAGAAGALMTTVHLAHNLIFNLQCFRVSAIVNPAVATLRTPDVDRSLNDMQQLAVGLSATCRNIIESGALSPEALLRNCNSLDGALTNLQIEAQFFEAAIQQGTAAAA